MNQQELTKITHIIDDLQHAKVEDLIGAVADALEGLNWIVTHNHVPRKLRRIRPLPTPRGRPKKKKK